MNLKAGHPDFSPTELADFLLRETGQTEQQATNPGDLLSYLKLAPMVLDLESALPGKINKPRGVLAFHERIVAVHSGLYPQRATFTALHEIAHYVLPQHRTDFYLCDDEAISFLARNRLEREASEFAAELLFQGDRFTLESSSMPLTALSIKQLSGEYRASFEATARRMVFKSFRDCMLVVFEPKPGVGIIDPNRERDWMVKYVVPSVSFANKFFRDLEGEVPRDVVTAVTQPGRDLADSVVREPTVTSPQGKRIPFIAEFFCNHYNIFALLLPK